MRIVCEQMGKYYESIICISDLQIPFHHQDAFIFIEAIKKRFWINSSKSLCINQGDEVDQHKLGKYITSPDTMSAGMEYTASLMYLKQLWDLFPEQKVCISNHTWRIFNKAMAAGIPRAFLREISDFMNAPKGVEWRHKWQYNGVIFEHGENVSGPNAALNAAIQNGMSTSIGHQHVYGGVTHISRAAGPIWGMNTGCLIDVNQYAFDYAKKARKKPTLGMGVILDGVPYFIPMILNSRGRWIKKLSI